MNAISVKNLSKHYSSAKKEEGFAGSLKFLFKRNFETVKAVDDISFEIEEGELVGFIGPNGAGKPTTLKCLSGLLYPTSGSVSVLGYKPYKRDHKFLKQISLVMGQKNQLWWDLPPIETFSLNKEIYEINDKDYKETLDKLVDMLDVGKILDTQVRKLSLGQRMKCELIASLIHKPKVLYLDEPTIGPDVVMQERVRSFIRNYNKNSNSTIILTSHYMKDVETICKRIIIINNRKILYDGSLSEIIKKYSDRKVVTVYLTDKKGEDEILKHGKLFKKEGEKLILYVRRDNPEGLLSIINSKSVKDVTVENVTLEEVISSIFTENE